MRAWLLVGAIGFAGCVINVQPCADGIQDGAETGIDCGGVCGPCPNGQGCAGTADCQSGNCVNNVCEALPTCTDGIQNQNETATDCGGPCAACGDGLGCKRDSDCTSQVCGTNLLCAAPACNDNVQNGDETGLDCGGSCPPCGHSGGSPFMSSDGVPPPNTINRIASDQTVNIVAGEYGIERYAGATGDPSGATFHLSWIGDSTNAVFYGSVWSAGTIANVQTTGFSSDDEVSTVLPVSGAGGAGERVDFNSAAPGGDLEGISFEVTSTTGTNQEPVYFDLYIEGVADSHLSIWFIDGNTMVAANPNMGLSFTGPFGLDGL